MKKSYKNESSMPCLFHDIPVARSLTTAHDPARPKRATAGDIRRSSHGASQSVQHQITIKHWTASWISRMTLDACRFRVGKPIYEGSGVFWKWTHKPWQGSKGPIAMGVSSFHMKLNLPYVLYKIRKEFT
ncbi:hypothetical protein K439DRAFT_339598 [Ramaria rubella]|nr:hypothetical protein K439DRAFT_339598 [Ramaria rubella]